MVKILIKKINIEPGGIKGKTLQLAAFSSITRGTQTSISLHGKSGLTGSPIIAIDLITGTLRKVTLVKYHKQIHFTFQ